MAKDDNLDAADPNKDKKNQDQEELMNDEEKEKINEQGDEVTTNDSNSLMRKFRVSFVGSFRLIFFFFFTEGVR